MTAVARAGSGKSQGPRTPTRSPTWVAEDQVLDAHKQGTELEADQRGQELVLQCAMPALKANSLLWSLFS